MNADFVLASASPRRKQLLQQIGARFEVFPVDTPEHSLSGESPSEYVQRLALAKARTGYDRYPGSLPAMGADTAVVLDHEVFGKPRDEEDAIQILLRLSGRCHQVLSGVAMVAEGAEKVKLVETLVHFRDLSEQECRRYWATGEPADKAGAYGIQGFGAVFVDRITGSYSNVVGLPLTETCHLLRQFGVGYWKGETSG